MSPKAQAPTAYFRQIDGLRALAVMGPVFVHLWPRNFPHSPYTHPLVHLGSLGVTLFFVISGFLITGILLSAREHVDRGTSTIGGALRSFYLRRSLRIFPIYYLTLIVLMVLGMEELKGTWPWYFAYLSNFKMIGMKVWPGELSHLWSLSVEEQFYLLWPLLVLTIPKRGLPWLFVFAFLLGPVSRILIALADGPVRAISISPMSCLDALSAGGMLAYWLDRLKEPRYWRLLRVLGNIGLVTLIVQAVYYVFVLKGGPLTGQMFFIRTSATLWFCLVIAAAALERTGGFGRFLMARPVAFIGRTSYGIYLYHPFTYWGLEQLVGYHPQRSVGLFCALVLATLALSTISWYAIERPINGLKRFFPY